MANTPSWYDRTVQLYFWCSSWVMHQCNKLSMFSVVPQSSAQPSPTTHLCSS